MCVCSSLPFFAIRALYSRLKMNWIVPPRTRLDQPRTFGAAANANEMVLSAAMKCNDAPALVYVLCEVRVYIYIYACELPYCYRMSHIVIGIGKDKWFASKLDAASSFLNARTYRDTGSPFEQSSRQNVLANLVLLRLFSCWVKWICKLPVDVDKRRAHTQTHHALHMFQMRAPHTAI